MARDPTAATLIVFLFAGCLGGTPDAVRPDVEPTTEPVEGHPVVCRILDVERKPLLSAACGFEFGNLTFTDPVNATGQARRVLPAGSSGVVQGSAEGHVTKVRRIVVDAPKRVEMVLETLGVGGVGQNQSTNGSGAVPLELRTWSAPLTVSRSGNEPHLAVDSTGIIYYAPTSTLYRSDDGGKAFAPLSITGALPTLGSDTSVSIAPDDSVWFSRYWGYAGGTLGCTSANHGDSWTCDNAALPGATDRMWIVGVSSTEGYLQTNEGLYHHVWAHTTTGSTKYVPYATTTQILAVRNGNMVYDAVNQAVFQIEWVGSTLRLYRIDGATGLLTATNTAVPAPYALPWISTSEGVLWTTGETAMDGGRVVVAARSSDQGKTWRNFPVSVAPKSATFSYVAAGPDGRVAVVYYGSDKPGPSTNNGGNWSLYIAETDDGLSENPTWVETQLVALVHQGNICIGLNCEQTGSDPRARYSGDLIGVAMDSEGNAHVAYNDDADGQGTKNQYLRQHRL